MSCYFGAKKTPGQVFGVPLNSYRLDGRRVVCERRIGWTAILLLLNEERAVSGIWILGWYLLVVGRPGAAATLLNFFDTTCSVRLIALYLLLRP